jgi:acyl CoA:acetate/3-ketoacid CoA transferase
LGYVVEVSNTASNRLEEPIQYVPKRVVGLLKKEVVLGVAASKNASACWTKETVFTWGTNSGQLGTTTSMFYIFFFNVRAQVMIKTLNLFKCYRSW